MGDCDCDCDFGDCDCDCNECDDCCECDCDCGCCDACSLMECCKEWFCCLCCYINNEDGTVFYIPCECCDDCCDDNNREKRNNSQRYKRRSKRRNDAICNQPYVVPEETGVVTNQPTSSNLAENHCESSAPAIDENSEVEKLEPPPSYDSVLAAELKAAEINRV